MDYIQNIQSYLANKELKEPLFLLGDCLNILELIPKNSVDCIITSPPYWGQRQYSGGGIGLEASYSDYINNVTKITNELYRILKPSGSFWLNIGDTYRNKKLLGIPWRVVLAFI